MYVTSGVLSSVWWFTPVSTMLLIDKSEWLFDTWYQTAVNAVVIKSISSFSSVCVCTLRMFGCDKCDLMMSVTILLECQVWQTARHTEWRAGMPWRYHKQFCQVLIPLAQYVSWMCWWLWLSSWFFTVDGRWSQAAASVGGWVKKGLLWCFIWLYILRWLFAFRGSQRSSHTNKNMSWWSLVRQCWELNQFSGCHSCCQINVVFCSILLSCPKLHEPTKIWLWKH